MAAPLRHSVKQVLCSYGKCLRTSEKLWKQTIRLGGTEAVKQKTWQLCSAVYLQRYPIITCEMSDIEKEFKEYMDRKETNESLLSDHELDLKAAQEHKAAVALTAHDLEDQWANKFEEFKFSPRVSEADENKDMTSTQRKMDEKLILIVKYKFEGSGESSWILPQIRHQDGESMKQTAERSLYTACGEEIQATFLGNAPSGYLSYKLPQSSTEYGVKLFFFKASYESGTAVATDNVLEYKWVTVNEAKEYLPKVMVKEINKFDISL